MSSPYNLSFNPVWDFVDLTGEQVDDTYYLFTLSNDLPYLPATVYHTQSGTPWANPIKLLSNGTLPVNVYWDPTVTYRLELRHGNTQSDALIYLVENYIPFNDGSGPTPVTPENNSTDNLLTNPQFYDKQFQVSSLTSTANVTTFAPGWTVTTVGSGTLTITQVNIAGVTDIPGNPSYYISIANNNFTSVTLQQTFAQNGALWANEAVAMNMTGKASSLTSFSTYLTYSGASQSLNIIEATLAPGWDVYTGATTIPTSTNANTGANAYTTLNINWTGNVTVSLTNMQLVGQAVEDELINYAQIPIERQIDHEFHYYLPQLEYKPIPSYLVGWDFPLNPCQALGASAVTSSASSYYVADQTVLFQTVASNFTMNLDNQGLNLTSAASSTFAVIQYLGGNTPVELLQQRMAAIVQGFTNSGSINGTVNLLWTASTVPVLPLSVVTAVTNVAEAPTTTFAAGWNVVPRVLGAAEFTLTSTSSIHSFVGFDATAVANIKTATFFAIVISFNTATAGQIVTISRAALNGGDIATLPAPQTPDEILRECQYYYETSYPLGVIPGASTASTPITRPMGWSLSFSGAGAVTSSVFNPTSFDVQFNTIKRSTPNVLLYSPDSTSGSAQWSTYVNGAVVNAGTNRAVSGCWQATTSTKVVNYLAVTNINFGSIAGDQVTNPNGVVNCYLKFHYVVDARLGIF